MVEGRRLARKAWERLWTRHVDYPFISHLCYANAGMLERGNITCFDHVVQNLRSGSSMLEIGSFCGLSTNVITYLNTRHKKHARLFTCDEWKFEGLDRGATLPDSTLKVDQYQQFVREAFLRNVSFFSGSDRPHTIEVSSERFFSLWQEGAEVTDVFERRVRLGGPLHFVYIDGNHSYDGARQDFENSDKVLASGGFILFDDSSPSSPYDCYRVAQEVQRDSRYRLVMRNPNFLFQKI
jgi:hypothetical protein